MAATGGEDYELILVGSEDAIARTSAALDAPLTIVGRIVEGEPRVRVLDAAGAEVALPSRGWDHLAKDRPRVSAITIHAATPGATRKLGERIGRMLRAGDVVLLSGELGAGKTVLAQGIGRGLGVTDPIKSSSFVIMNEYDGATLRLYHADLYRLEDPEQVAELALDELAAKGVLVVEWPERAPNEMPPEHLLVRLAYDGAKSRTIEIEGVGERYAEIARRSSPLSS